MIVIDDKANQKIKKFLRNYVQIKSWVYDKVEGEFKVYDKKAERMYIIHVMPGMELDDVFSKLEYILKPERRKETFLEKLKRTINKILKR